MAAVQFLRAPRVTGGLLGPRPPEQNEYLSIADFSTVLEFSFLIKLQEVERDGGGMALAA